MIRNIGIRPPSKNTIEQQQVERRERTDHQRFQNQKRHHVGRHARRNRPPARNDAERHQRRRQDHERQRDAIDPHVIANAGREPGRLFDKLESAVGGIEARHQDQRYRKGDDRGPQRNPARGAVRGFVAAPRQQINQQCAEPRQEGRRRKEWARSSSYWPPTPNMNQVIRPATPISIANA